MRITGRQLKQMIDARVRKALSRRKINEGFILEADEAPQNPALKPELGDSIDAQIDKKLMEYEGESKTAKNEGLDYRSLAYRILFEADADEEEPAADDAGDDDLESALGGEGGEPTEVAAKMSLDDIEIYEFASNVARLIDNVENLIEFRDTIMKRSMNFLKKSYDATVLEQYTQIMDKQFDIVVGENDVDKEFEITPPPAVGAGVPPGG